MRAYQRGNGRQYLPKLFTWMGKRTQATEHLELHTDCKLWEKQTPPCAPEALLSCLQASGHGVNVNMKTLDLTIEDRRYLNPSAPLMGQLQDWVIPLCPNLDTISLSLDRAPSWLTNCPTLRHLCLFFPPLGTDQAAFKESCNMHSMNLPNLQTLFLQGGQHLVELSSINFRDSKKLDVVHVQDCWIDDLLLQPSCNLFVSAEVPQIIIRMVEFQEHPLVKSASHVRLLTELTERMAADDYYNDIEVDEGEDEQLQTSAVGIPNMFSAMRSLRLTWCTPGVQVGMHTSTVGRCYIDAHQAAQERNKEDFAIYVWPIRCLPKHWQHENLKELIIEGDYMGVTIAALPSLETLLVFSHTRIAFNFVDPERLGQTIARMRIRGNHIVFKPEQRQVLCKALRGRNLELVGDWEVERRVPTSSGVVIALHPKDECLPTMAELLEQAGDGVECLCGACPSCLGIGKERLDKEDPPKAVWYDCYPFGPKSCDW